MIWFILAIMHALFWALVIVFDRFIVENIFSRPIQGLFITIPSACVMLLALLPLLTWPDNLTYIIFALLAGLLMQLAQASYFCAMHRAKEAGVLSAIEGTYPVIVTLGALLMGNVISLFQWLGIVIVLVSVVLMEWHISVSTDKRFYAFALLDVLFLAGYTLLVDSLLSEISFFSFYGPYSLSIIFFGLSPFLFLKKERAAFIQSWGAIKKYLPHLSVMELLNIAAVICGILAIDLGHPGLATSVMSTVPAFVFIFSFLLSSVTSFRMAFPRPHKLFTKISIVLVMSIGLGFIAS